MAQSAQKLVYENRIDLPSGSQITLTPTVLGIVLQNLRNATITQITAEKGIKHILDPITSNVTFYNDGPNDIQDAYVNVTAQHTIQYKPVVEPPTPGSAPIDDDSLIRGKEERTFAVLSPELNAINPRLPFDTVGETTLPVGTILWDALNVGRFSLERAGKYQISALASFHPMDQALEQNIQDLAVSALLRDPANAGSGTISEQQIVAPSPLITIGLVNVASGNFIHQEIVEVTPAQAANANAADRTFEIRVASGEPTAVLRRGFIGQVIGAKCANIIIEKIA